MRRLDELKAWAAAAPAGTLVAAERLTELLDELDLEPVIPPPVAAAPLVNWRERLWTVDSDVRIGREELLEAVDRNASWLYRHTGPSATHRLPHRKLDGMLTFVVGEVRAWLREREEIVHAGPIEGPPRLRLHARYGGTEL